MACEHLADAFGIAILVAVMRLGLGIHKVGCSSAAAQQRSCLMTPLRLDRSLSRGHTHPFGSVGACMLCRPS